MIVVEATTLIDLLWNHCHPREEGREDPDVHRSNWLCRVFPLTPLWEIASCHYHHFCCCQREKISGIQEKWEVPKQLQPQKPQEVLQRYYDRWCFVDYPPTTPATCPSRVHCGQRVLVRRYWFQQIVMFP